MQVYILVLFRVEAAATITAAQRIPGNAQVITAPSICNVMLLSSTRAQRGLIRLDGGGGVGGGVSLAWTSLFREGIISMGAKGV